MLHPIPTRARALLLAAHLSTLLCACGDDGTANDAGDPLTCDAFDAPLAEPGDPIDGDTYETFAAEFFDSYCTRCHHSDLDGVDARGGAPAGFDWDRPEVVRARLSEIRSAVGVTQFMPFDAPFPSCDERRRIVRWIDADAP